jgi:tRNA-Thr(GGU) m(6)t(6)A37 methyltransferase TsaA
VACPAGRLSHDAAARSPSQRLADARRRLDQDTDVWVATADPHTGAPYLVPLSFLWDGGTLLIATPEHSPTGRNLLATGLARLGIGPTRDLVLVEGVAQATAVAAGTADAFAAKAGFDPRQLTGYRYFRIRPQRVQAWREANELAGRDLMRDGRWLVPDTAGPASAPAAAPSLPNDPFPQLAPVGWVESGLAATGDAPKQADEGAPPARIMFRPGIRDALSGLRAGDQVVVLTWLHRGDRDVLAVHPRDDPSRPRLGVFATRSQDRPNPIGLHTVTITEIGPDAISVSHLEAIDGTPVLDVKPVLGPAGGR